MAAFKKSYGIALAVVALSLTLMGVVLAATTRIPRESEGRPGLERDPPRSTSLPRDRVERQSYTVSARQCQLRYVERRGHRSSFRCCSPQTSVELRMVRDHVYAEAADISSGSGSRLTSTRRRFGIALELTQPASDLNLIKGFNTSRSRRADIQRPIASRATTSRSPMCSHAQETSSARSTSR